MKFNALVPELSVSNIQKSLDFYVKVLKFKIEYERPQDKFAFLSYDKAQLMIEQHNDHWNVAELIYPFGRGVNFQIETSNIKQIQKSLQEHNIQPFKDIFVSSYIAGNQTFKELEILVLDPDGYLLRFSQGIETLTDEMKKLKITPKFVIVGEPTDSSLSFSSRGNSIFISQMLGKACHSSKPELGINAILLSMQMVNALEEISFQNKNDISISVVDIQGGQAPNIIPDYCQMRFSIRSTNVRKLNEVKKMLYQKHKGIEKVSGSALINVLDIPPYKCEKTIFIQNFMNKNNIKSSEQDYTTEAGVIQQKFNDAEIVIFGPGDPQNIHKKGESICISRLQQYTKLLLNFIEDYPMRVKVCNKGPHSNRKEEFCR